MEILFKDTSPKEWKNDARTVWLLARPHLFRLSIAILCSLLLSLINGAIAWMVKPSLDSLFVTKNRAFLLTLPIGVFLLFVLRGSFAFCNNFLMNSVGAKIVRALRQSAYEKLLALPMSFFSEKSGGSMVSRVLNDIGSLESLIAFTTKNFFVESATVLILALVALYRRWDLALLSFIIIPLVVIVSDRLGKRMKRTSTQTRKLISAVTKIIHETLAGVRIIKSFTLEDEMTHRNRLAVSEHYRNVMREVRIHETTDALIEVIAGSGVAVLLWYGSYLIVNDKMSVGDFFSFVAAVLMMYTPLKRMSRVNNNFQIIRASLHRIKEIFLSPGERGGSLEKRSIEGAIRFEGVSFSYPEGTSPVLQDISLDIRAGETVAIVGYSGAGKSTLTDLLLGFWDSYTGKITIDGTELREYSLRSLRSHIGVVPQDVVLFDDTVRNNILFGKPGASDSEVSEAARASYAEEFIKAMPHGYDTQIGERGVKLSGGQKQRISLARAIIKNPKLLILDEATSSLDTDSEAKIQQALERILPGRTTIMIAHRLSTIQKADRIVVMDRGRIIQEGTHGELAARQGVYRELYAMQFGLSRH